MRNGINNVSTGDKSLDGWLSYFSGKKKSNTRFIKLLKKNDKHFLTHSPEKDVDDVSWPDDGLLESDFRAVAFQNVSGQLLELKNRLILAMYYNVDFSPWIKKYGEVFFKVIELALIEGDYEKYGIAFEKVVVIAVKKKYIEKNDFFGVSLLRGLALSKRYTSAKEKEKLKKTIKTNAFKIMMGV